MKPSLETILRATLKVKKMSYSDWEILRYTRTREVVTVMQMLCFVANHYGYKAEQIAAFLGRDRVTVIYGIKQQKNYSEVYPDVKNAIDEILENLAYEQTHTCHGFIARSSTGLLLISPKKPERCAGYWISEGAKPYVNQKAFPQITWSSEPVKVTIKISIDDEEV